MANEIEVNYKHNASVYVLIRNRISQIWNTNSLAFENYLTANYSNYAISLTEQGTASAFFAGTFPATIPPGVYGITAKNQVGGSPAESDTTLGIENYQWNGSVTLPLSDLATSGQLGQVGPVKIYRGQMIQNFPFKLVSAADHVTPFISGIVSGQISRDGGAFGGLQSGNVTEIGLGWYSVNLTSGDLLANTAAVLFNGVGVSGGQSDQRDFGLILQRVSGSF